MWLFVNIYKHHTISVMLNQQYSELALNERLAQKLKKGILLSSSLVLLSLAWLLLGHGLYDCTPYRLYVAGAFLAAGACLTVVAPCLFMMLIQLRRLSIGCYDLALSSESIVRKHYRGASLISREQWSPSHMTQVCISRSVLGREQTLVTRSGFFLSLFFKDEHYYTVYFVDAQHRTYWLLTSSDCEQIRHVYQGLKSLLPLLSSQDNLDTATHILRLTLRQSEEGGHHSEYGRATHLFFAGFMLTGFSLMSGVLAYHIYGNSTASGAWLRSTGTLQNQQVVTKVSDGKEVRQIHATVQYSRHKQVISKPMELSEGDLKEQGIELSDVPCELFVYWQKEHPEKLRTSPPHPTSRPFYFIFLSLVLFVSQVIPLRMLRPYPKEHWQ